MNVSDEKQFSEFAKKKQKSLKQKSVYILPSMLTAMGLFSGFFSIMNTIRVMAGDEGTFYASAIAIFVAAFLDGLDGRIARLMKAESEFGFQFDSIADVVSFGVAPAVLIYAAYLYPLERWGWFGAFLYVACAGIRLARFNVISKQVTEKKYFKGLASPIAAGGLVMPILLVLPYQGMSTNIIVCAYTVFLSLLMVSNVRFRSFKKLDAAKGRPTRSFLLILLLVLLIFTFQEVALAVLFVLYLIWGLIEEVSLFRRRRKSDPSVPFVPFGERDDEDDSII